jgi:hypothetical protein
VKIVVKPKNSLMCIEDDLITAFYNIETGEVGHSYTLPPWVEELADDWLIFNQDTMYIKYVEDLVDPAPKTITICDCVNEEGFVDEILCEYNKIWDVVKDRFENDLNLRENDEISKRYILDINIRSTYDSYAGDYDCVCWVEKLIDTSGGFTEHMINEHKGYNIFL